MRQMIRWMWIVGAPTWIASCALDSEPQLGKTSSQPLVLTEGTKVNIEGVLDFGGVVFKENPTTLLEVNDFHGYEFDGKAGGVVTITMTSKTCGAPDTVLDLFGPEDANGDRGAQLAENDDAFLSCFLDSQIRNFRLPVDGTYLIVATSFLQEGGGNYQLALACNNNACALDGSPTFRGTRISQTDIDQGVFSPAELFEIGDFLFETVYVVQDGMGNALAGLPANNQPRPNFREIPNNVHFAAFGAPEAQSCITCHNVGGDDGGGDNNHNIFQIGDGVNRASGVPRNGIALLGLGYRQKIGEEMTAELKAQLAAAKAQAVATQAAVTQPLTAKNVSFGSLVANPDGSINFAGLQGVDTDLVVKPFGWKGREALLRRFVEGGFRVHFGMQTQPSIEKHCANPNINTFGNGPDCQDPDGDGVKEEITEGQLSAEAIYMGLLEAPVRVPAASAALQQRANAGEALFSTVGCAGCHVGVMRLDNPVHVEPADTTGGAGIAVNLATDSQEPRPDVQADGSLAVELWSDFKRHDMGAALADVKNFNQIAANQFVTQPLWGVASSAPYLHDGRAATLNDAILAHGGEAQAARNAYAALSADDQSKIQEFLGTLGRIENVEAGAVDLSDFTIEQTSTFIDFTLPQGTLVPHGNFLIVARNATQAQFEAFYGKALPSNVVYVNSAAELPRFPSINGNERFTLFDPNFVTVDGPTVPQPTSGGRNFSRASCGAPSNVAASWTSVTAAKANATPGTGPLSTGLGRICITEFTDASSSAFEYVEILVE